MALSFIQHLTDIPFAVIGHRGAAGIAPENTLKSFSTALDHGCCAIELDVYTSHYLDGSPELLVIHDKTLNRTTNGSGFVGEFDVEYLRSLNAGEGERIPLLAEVVSLLHDHASQTGTTPALNVELKGPNTAAPLASSMKLPDMSKMLASLPLLVSSFDHHEVLKFRELQPTCEIALLYRRYRDDWAKAARAAKASAINIDRKIATQERVGAIRDAGYAVFVYTVNTVAEAEKLKAMGVSGVFSDRPDILL